MSREGRSQPIQPFAGHGFVDPGPGAVGTVPPRTIVVPHDPRPRQFYVPQIVPISISGVLALSPPTTVVPPQVVNVDRVDRRVRVLDPIVLSGVLAPQAPVTVTPPGSVNVDRVDRRANAPDPIAISAALLSAIQAPTVLPVGPFVIPIEDRRRFVAAISSFVSHGLDDVLPPPATAIEPDDRRRRLRIQDPISIRGVVDSPIITIIAPPQPFFVPLEDRRRFLVALKPTIIRGTSLPVVVATGQEYTLPLMGVGA